MKESDIIAAIIKATPNLPKQINIEGDWLIYLGKNGSFPIFANLSKLSFAQLKNLAKQFNCSADQVKD